MCKISYPAIASKGSKGKYFAMIPDVDGYAENSSVDGILNLIKYCIKEYSRDNGIPKPSKPEGINLDEYDLSGTERENAVIVLVEVDFNRPYDIG